MKPESILKLEKEFNIVIDFREEFVNLDAESRFYINSYYTLNEIGEINGLCLYIFSIFGNDIDTKNFYEIIETLPYLVILELPNNDFENLDFIGKLINLRHLDLSGSEIFEISFLENLKELVFLNLSNNFNLSDISILKKLSKLEYLDLSKNRITDVICLKELVKLEYLDLEYNQITDITYLKKLNQLAHLYLSSNQITDISALKDLTKIEKLDIANNYISDITFILKNVNLKEVQLKGNKKIEIDFPKEVLEAGWEAVKQYSEKSKESVPFKNVKVLLLGNPNIGKSNLLEFLETNEIPEKNYSTHGVKYKKIVLNEINFHIWDFGGQEYFHATHKLFFSPNALNIVLWGKDIPRNSDEIENQFFDLNYWLRIVEQLNCNSSKEEVLIIENKIDLNNPINQETILNQKELSENYNILNLSFTNFSLLNLKRTEIFKNIFFEKAESIISKFNYPSFYEVFWKRIQELNKDFVSVDEINNRPHKENVIAALKVFHNMGMLLYFDNLIPNKVFCKPQALLDLLYEKVLSKEKKDRLTKSEIEKSIFKNSLELRVEQVVNLLKHFDLVFEIKDEKDVYFIPQYLKSINPYIRDLKEQIFSGCNIRIYGDNYLISLAMLKIFSKLGNYVNKDENEYWFWQNGIIVKKDNSILMIEYNSLNRTIELYQDKDCKNFDLQKAVVDYILDLPEEEYFPKRNYSNYIEIVKKRVSNSPNLLSNKIQNNNTINNEDIKEYFAKIEERSHNESYSKGFNWKSKYFTVQVSIDNEYFVDWKDLNESIEIQKVKTKNIEGKEKVENVSCYNKYLNVDEIKDLIEENKNNIKYDINIKIENLKIDEMIMGDKFKIIGNNPNSQFGGKKNEQINYHNIYNNNDIVSEIKDILSDLKSSEQINEEWRKNFTDAYIEMSKLEEADEKRTETKSVSYLKNFFVNAKEVKDWVGIALLPGEIVSKGEKMIELGKQLFNLQF